MSAGTLTTTDYQIDSFKFVSVCYASSMKESEAYAHNRREHLSAKAYLCTSAFCERGVYIPNQTKLDFFS